MPTYSFGSDEFKNFQSANSFRAAVERDDAEKEMRKLIKELEKDAKIVSTPIVKEATRDIYKDIKEDDIGKQALDAKRYIGAATGFVTGVALVVASVAAESSYNKAILDAREFSDRERRDEYDRTTRENSEKQSRTLTEYTGRVEETTRHIESTQRAYHVEFQDTRDEALRVIESAKNAYEKEQNALRKEERRSDDIYKRDVGAAEKQYEADVKRISSEYSGVDRDKELQKAAERRDSQIDSASKRHNEEIRSITDRAADAETKLRTAVNHQNDVIQTAQIKYQEAVQDAKRENTIAQTRLDQYQSQSRIYTPQQLKDGENYALRNGTPEETALIKRVNEDRAAAARAESRGEQHVSMISAEDYKRAEQIKERYTQATVVAAAYTDRNSATSPLISSYDKMSGKEVAEYADRVLKEHRDIGLNLALQLGTKEEVAAIQKALSDIETKRAANPGAAIDNTYKQAEDIIKKYAGNINSENRIDKSLQSFHESSAALVKAGEKIQGDIGRKNNEIKNIDSQISSLKSSVDQIVADKRALSTGKDALGIILTDEKKREINDRLQKSGDITEQTRKIANLNDQKNKATAELNKLTTKLDDNKALSKKMSDHMATLSKDKEIISLATKGKKVALQDINNSETSVKVGKLRAVIDGTNKYTTAIGGVVGTAFGVATGKGAADYVNAFTKSQESLGRNLALKMGDASEIEVLKKVLADNKAKAEAKEKGVAHVPLASDAERQRADQIIKKYTGQFDSKEGIQQTIKQRQKAINDLKAESAGLKDKITKTTAQIGKLDKEIDKLQKNIDQIAADKKALKTGLDNSGAKLTPEQRKAIAERVQKGENIAEHAKNLNELKMKKNAAKANLDKLTKKLDDNTSLIKGLQNSVNELKKNGKAIADAIKRGAKQGMSKTADRMQKAGVGMIVGSIANISKKLDNKLNEGNDLDKEFNKMTNGMRKFADRYDAVLGIAGVASTLAIRIIKMPNAMMMTSGSKLARLVVSDSAVGGFFRLIGADAAVGGFLNKRIAAMQNRMNSKAMRLLGKGGKFVGGIGGSILKAPSKILKAPTEIKRLPQKMLKNTLTGGFRLTRKVTGVAVGVGVKAAGVTLKGGARIAGKGIRFVGRSAGNALGRTRVGRWASAKFGSLSERFRLFGGRTSDFFKKMSAKFDPLRRVNNGIKKIFGFIFASISAIISFFISIIMGLIGLLLTAAITVVVLILLMAMLTSMITAISNWLSGLSAQNRSLIKNEPEYLVNQAVNYRNAEMDIFDLFYRASDDTSLIKVNNSPIYYALYDKGLHFFGWTGEKKLKAENVGAYNDYLRWSNDYDGLTTLRKSYFKMDEVAKYDEIKLSYYSAEDLKVDGSGNYVKDVDGQYVLKPSASAYSYELSNARDALSMVDTLYTTKQDTMQKLEVLAYLGVGNYQLAKKSNVVEGNVITENLFWATHKLIYRSGNKSDQIWFHTTNDPSGSYKVARINNYLKYKVYSNGDVGEEYVNNGVCDNYKTTTLRYYEYQYGAWEEVESRSGEATLTSWGDCGYKYGNCAFDEDDYWDSSGNKLESYGDDVCEMTLYSYCDHRKGTTVLWTKYIREKKRVSQTMEVQTCQGHLNLDVALVVTMASEENDLIFKEARAVQGVENDELVESNGLFTYDMDQGVFGWGAVVHTAFRPYNDWADGSDNIGLAKTKTFTDFEYEVPEGKTVRELSIGIEHYDGYRQTDAFWSLAQSSENKLLLGMRVKDGIYYVKMYASGEQKDIEYFNLDGSNGGTVSFAMATVSGHPYPIPRVNR